MDHQLVVSSPFNRFIADFTPVLEKIILSNFSWVKHARLNALQKLQADTAVVCSVKNSFGGWGPTSYLCIQGQQLQKRETTVSSSRAAVITEAKFGLKTKATSKPYICKDCGYIYEDRQPFETLDKSYRCPVCNSPKRRQASHKFFPALATFSSRKASLWIEHTKELCLYFAESSDLNLVKVVEQSFTWLSPPSMTCTCFKYLK